ncbi:translation elongation factor Ts [Helicobacter kayseriensis]|uniref:translation elongation factor Ts n=1 Tax=Helicobacter kayseriensis TaxID=2905877 RepID=UPI001E55E16D|nr:translation elongation factor Ts [Helicobacter kayseriensis]MCE3046584.1 translation elongation factor Ts [Helicobacter kayseriensis]MCE3048114.1 translation elongation factor Ts [Helicobacter kayseriensis]
MEISAQLVKQLREMTDAGMMDCKKALVEVGGDIEKAVEFLREKGLSKAAKKADRVAAEGAISVKVASDFKNAVMLEINSETDFVAKNDGFVSLVEKSTELVQSHKIQSVEELNTASVDGETFDAYLKGQIAKIGENIVVRRVANVTVDGNNIVNGYVHSNGRVGVIIAMSFKNQSNSQKIVELARNLCMHAAAMKPQYLSYKQIDADFIAKEKVALIAELEKENEELKRLGKPLHKIPTYVSQSELTSEVLAQAEENLKADLKAQGKPEAIWDKILPGQMERFIADNTLIDQRMTLLGQFYVMDDKKTIAQVLESMSKELGDEIQITEYIRFELGEGIEKEVVDFAQEVMAQL